jgi:hypothetical protein
MKERLIINSDSSLKVGKKKPFILSRSNLIRDIIPLFGHFEKDQGRKYVNERIPYPEYKRSKQLLRRAITTFLFIFS